MTAKKHYSFILFGKPKAQCRPRTVIEKTGKVRWYDPMSDKKALDRITLMTQMRDAGLVSRLEEPVLVELTFHMGGADKKSTAGLKGKPKPTMPDIDNMVKYYLDIMNDLIFKDDRFVTHLICSKTYSEKKRVEIIITPISEVLKKEKQYD